jgi:argininosuccinate lyase
LIATLQVDGPRLESAAPGGFALATDVAEWLVRQGISFRDAHEISGAFVAYCEELGVDLPDLTDDQLADVDPRLTPEVRSVLSVRGALEARSSVGGTAPARVAEQLAALKALVDDHLAWAAAP